MYSPQCKKILISLLSLFTPTLFAIDSANVVENPIQESLISIHHPIRCNPADLVSAINTANSNGSGTIHLAHNCVYVLKEAVGVGSGLPDILGTVTLIGGENTVITRGQTAPALRIFHVATTGTLVLRNLSVMNGLTANSGGGVFNEGILNVENVTFSHNDVGTSNGGGVFSFLGSVLKTKDSRFLFNTAGLGGAMAPLGLLQAQSTQFTNNRVIGLGGAIFLDPGGTEASISHCNLSYNNAAGVGGAIFNGTKTTRIDFSIIHNNHSDTDGGGIFAGDPAQVTLNHTEVIDNTPNNCAPAIAGCTG